MAEKSPGTFMEERITFQGAERLSENSDYTVDVHQVGCITFSVDGHLLEFSPNIERLTGYPSSVLSGLSLQNLVYNQNREAVLDAFEKAQVNAPNLVPVRFSLMKADQDLDPGAYFHFVPLLNRRKEVSAVVGYLYFQDGTRHNDEESKSQEISKLIGKIGHDIRTPLMSIISATELLKDHPDNRDVIIEFLDRSSKRLFETVESVLRLARLDNDFELELAPNDLHEYVVETVEIFQHQSKEKGVDVRYVGPVESEMVALIDGAAVSRILVNLIDNALKYTESGSIEVSLSQKGSLIRIEVKDSGLGISPQFLPDIFTDFSRQAASDEIKREGLGLGLSITKRLVDMMNGSIKVESEEGVGSTFSVELPLIPVA